MAIFKPDIYKKNILKCLVFDLDNTLGLIDEKLCPKDVKKLIKKLKKDFKIYISSNNVASRIKPYAMDLDIEGESFSVKPLPKGLIRIRKRGRFKKNEMVMIGDQIVTDILSGKLYGVKTILVDPLGVEDLKITSVNRKIEAIIVRRYMKKGIFERGSYYE